MHTESTLPEQIDHLFMIKQKYIGYAFIFGGTASFIAFALIYFSWIEVNDQMMTLAISNFYFALGYYLSAYAILKHPQLYKINVALVILLGSVQLGMVHYFMQGNPYVVIWFPVSTLIMALFVGPWAGWIACGMSLLILVVFPPILNFPIPSLHAQVSLTVIEVGIAALGHLIYRRMAMADELIKDTMEALYISGRTDPMTGLLNRRGFYEEMDKLYPLHLRENKMFLIAIIDIDHFKGINDTYGHDAGDRAIIALTKALQSSVRQSDIIARMGGDEFIVLLPFTSCKKAKHWVGKLQNLTQDLHFEYKGQNIPLQLSIGMTSMSEQHEPIDQIIKQADEALYHAKENGRNQFVCYHEAFPAKSA